MKILVTGGSGFLGSHIADALSDAGHDVVLFDVTLSPHRRPDQEMVQGDILDDTLLTRAAAGCDAIYHLAAIADIDEARSDPRRTVQVNVLGALNALEAARAAGARRFVLASSIYVYSNQGSFYRTTKQTSEQLTLDYHERFGTDYTILRFGSLYGPRADRRNAIQNLLTQALLERRMEYSGTGKEVREYIHVLDAARASVDILAPEYRNEIIHVTGRERMTTGDMMALIAEMLGGDVAIAFRGDGMTGHYVQTPYNFTPRIGRKLTSATYIDVGLGLLDCLREIHQKKIQGDDSSSTEWDSPRSQPRMGS